MKRIAILAVLAACGGGPSVPGGGDDVPDGDPTTRIVSSNCQLVGNVVSIDVGYETTLGVGQAWESELLVLDGSSFGTQIGESQFFTCGFWTETGSGSSAKGCQRTSPDDPATENVSHHLSVTFEQQTFPPVDVMIFANTFDTPGGPSIGPGANDTISCF